MPRPRTIDRQKLLDSAQEAFWTRGYEGTSVEDISAASGVGNGSIYAAHTSKLGLFLAVFERYCDARVDSVRTIVDAHTGDFHSAVANYLELIVEECTSHPDRRGCLMLNSLTEMCTRYPDVARIGRRSVTLMEDILTARVVRGIEDGDLELDRVEIRPLGAHIVLVSQGLINLSRIGTEVASLHDIAAVSARMSANTKLRAA